MSISKIKTAYAAFVFGSLLAVILASLLLLGAVLAYYDLALPE